MDDILCPKCGGRSEIVRGEFIGSDEWRELTERCDGCNGSGLELVRRPDPRRSSALALEAAVHAFQTQRFGGSR